MGHIVRFSSALLVAVGILIYLEPLKVWIAHLDAISTDRMAVLEKQEDGYNALL